MKQKIVNSVKHIAVKDKQKQKMTEGIRVDLGNLRIVKSPRTDETLLMRTAYFIGRTAWNIHQIILNLWFRIVLGIAGFYLIMHVFEISVTIASGPGTIIKISF
jgi:hypothetical protein